MLDLKRVGRNGAVVVVVVVVDVKEMAVERKPLVLCDCSSSVKEYKAAQLAKQAKVNELN